MLSIAVCDDEVMECCNIAEKVKEILAELKISYMIQQFYSGQELMQLPDHFDIIFLDIIMRDMDGMRTAQMIREKAFDKIIIFISSSREFALEDY
ncbi:MAG: response regulator, partial [Lachnospiraceae bacterium]|nr:response regulator [Lachnospiraceae bacterium]